LKDFNFLLSFQIELLDNSKETRRYIDENQIDIFDESPVEEVAFPTLNYQKLSKYI